MSRKRTWQEKLADDKDLPRVVTLSGKMETKFGSGTMVIAAPREIDAAMKQVRRRKITTIDHIRTMLAQKHDATTACPMTTGIFAWIAAHAANEALEQGKKRVTPYWRTLKSGGELNPKYPGGIDFLIERLTEEGHQVIQKGKRYMVQDYERAAFQPKPD